MIFLSHGSGINRGQHSALSFALILCLIIFVTARQSGRHIIFHPDRWDVVIACCVIEKYAQILRSAIRKIPIFIAAGEGLLIGINLKNKAHPSC
jgi:hypothetical protein